MFVPVLTVVLTPLSAAVRYFLGMSARSVGLGMLPSAAGVIVIGPITGVTVTTNSPLANFGIE